MNSRQKEIMKNGQGFIAALDQSGGSTPKALTGYGIPKEAYSSEEEMFSLVHEMRSRIMKSPSFSSEHILAAILFEQTMDRQVEGKLTADYLWEEKGIVPILKVDEGLAELEQGVQLMKPIKSLEKTLKRARERRIFGTKMRSLIKKANPDGIKAIIEQQYEYAKRIIAAGLVPIVEPEVDIKSEDKGESEIILKQEMLKQLDLLPEGDVVMLKLSLPDESDFYRELIEHPRVLRVAALSGGYSREEAVALLASNKGMIASFSRALVEGLAANQIEDAFNKTLKDAIEKIYRASIS